MVLYNTSRLHSSLYCNFFSQLPTDFSVLYFNFLFQNHDLDEQFSSEQAPYHLLDPIHR